MRIPGPIPIEEFEYKVRRIINDYIVPPKNEYKLNHALRWMDRFRNELREIVRIRDVHDLFKVYEVENIIQCATLSAQASKERRESRRKSDIAQYLFSNRLLNPAANQATSVRINSNEVGLRDLVQVLTKSKK